MPLLTVRGSTKIPTPSPPATNSNRHREGGGNWKLLSIKLKRSAYRWMGNKRRQFPENYQQNRNVTTLFDIHSLSCTSNVSKVNEGKQAQFSFKNGKTYLINALLAHTWTNSDGLTWPTSYLLNKVFSVSILPKKCCFSLFVFGGTEVPFVLIFSSAAAQRTAYSEVPSQMAAHLRTGNPP